MKIYEFVYNPCIHESAPVTISVHRTKEGALKAMRKHKNAERRKFNEIYAVKNPNKTKFGQQQHWSIFESVLLD